MIILAALTLVLDMKDKPELPNNFRKCNGTFIHQEKGVDKTGLRELRLSGSAQFSEKSLDKIYQELGSPENFYIIDLRQESHAFLDGIAVSWYTSKNWGNYGKTDEEALKDENQLIQNVPLFSSLEISKILKKDLTRGIEKDKKFTLIVEEKSSEAELAKKKHFNYFRLYCTDHLPPPKQEVERFIAFLKTLPDNAWVHIHCRQGIGRTTTFMVLYDILKNGDKVPLSQILLRQASLGGKDLVKLPPSSSWKRKFAEEKLQFIKTFYQDHTQNKALLY